MKKCLTILSLFVVASAQAVLISNDRLYTNGWANAGIAGGIPDSSGMTVSTTINSTGDSTDRTTTINNAIAACASNQVVVLGVGTFRVTGQLTMNNRQGVVLRGQGQGITIINSEHTGSWGLLMGNTSGDYRQYSGSNWIVNAVQGDTVLTFASTTQYTNGARISLHRNNSTNATWPVISTTPDTALISRALEHRTKIVSKTSSTVTILDPLPFDFPTNTNPQLHMTADGFAMMSGVEDLSIRFTSSGAVFGVAFWNADNCWLKNVEIKDAGSYIVYFLKAQHCMIQSCKLNGVQGSGSNGSGLLMEHSSMNVIHNNIIRFAFPNVEINFGCTGNVLAYNALLQSQSNIGMDGNHGAHNCFNLFEGNVAPNLKPDGYFGSVSHDTVLRNRFTGADNIGDAQGFAAVDIKRFARYYNVVGNVLGIATSGTYEQTTSGATGAAVYQLGYPNIGNTTFSGTAEPTTGDWWADWPNSGNLPTGFQERDLDVSNSLIRKGNYNSINAAVPAGESVGTDDIPQSYYLTNKPSWFYSLTWPPFNPTNAATATYRTNLTLSYVSIPAGYLYVYGTNPPADPAPPSGDGGSYVRATNAIIRNVYFR